jgi:hypothetical protein
MGRRRDTERAALLLARGVDWAQIVARSVRPMDQDLVREQAKLAIAREQRRYERTLARRSHQVQLYGIAAGGLTTFGVVDILNQDNGSGGAGFFIVGGLLSAALSVRAFLRKRNMSPPKPAPLPPPSLPSDAIGAVEATRLAHVRAQLGSMTDAVGQLHPEAGKELQRADDEAGRAFIPLVERLQVLDRLRRSMPGSPAATSATDAARTIASRLDIGVDSYERLLASAATMLGAPDISANGLTTELQAAAQGLLAYSHGLGVAAESDHTQWLEPN